MSVAQSLYFEIALILAFPVLVQAKYEKICSKYHGSFFDSRYSNLYLKLEEALINDSSHPLSKLRVGFTSIEEKLVSLTIHPSLEVKKFKNVSCENKIGALCYSESDQNWKFCSTNIGKLSYMEPSLEDYQSENHQLIIINFLEWLAVVHGTTMPLILTSYVFKKMPEDFLTYDKEKYDGITFSIDELDCNPSPMLLKCALSELWSWIKVYSEAGGRPESWDQDQKGSAVWNYQFRDYYSDLFQSSVMEFAGSKMSQAKFVKFCLAEYVIVSLSAALIIAAIFPLLHSQIVSKAASSLEYQSLYWGSAVVSNFFTYGLLLAAAKAWPIYYFIKYPIPSNIEHSIIIIVRAFSTPELFIASLCVLSVQEFVVYSILFVGALIASLRPNYGRVPLPTGMARVMFSVSLCFCFVCCPPRCRTKIPQILVLFGFMNFIYHCIMDALSIGFILFVEELRAIVITFTLLYMSLILFFVVFTSLIFFLVLRGPFYRTCIKCFAGALILITIFGAVMLIVVMYMIIFFSLKLNGFSGILTGLIPSIALSGASWYIKQKIMKQDTRDPSNNASVQLEYGAVTKRADNDSDSERTMLLP